MREWEYKNEKIDRLMIITTILNLNSWQNDFKRMEWKGRKVKK